MVQVWPNGVLTKREACVEAALASPSAVSLARREQRCQNSQLWPTSIFSSSLSYLVGWHRSQQHTTEKKNMWKWKTGSILRMFTMQRKVQARERQVLKNKDSCGGNEFGNVHTQTLEELKLAWLPRDCIKLCKHLHNSSSGSVLVEILHVHVKDGICNVCVTWLFSRYSSCGHFNALSPCSLN